MGLLNIKGVFGFYDNLERSRGMANAPTDAS